MSEYEFWDELGNIFNAIVAYQQKTIEFNKRFVTPWIKLSTVFDNNDHNAEALQAQKKAITIDQDNGANWLALGDVHFKMGAFDDAVIAYQKAIELNPKLGWAYANLALTYLTQQKYTEAVNLYVKSLEFISDEQDRAMILNRLGNAYRKVNDYQNAFIAFQMADECDGQNTGFTDRLDEVTTEQRVMPIVAEVYVNHSSDPVAADSVKEEETDASQEANAQADLVPAEPESVATDPVSDNLVAESEDEHPAEASSPEAASTSSIEAASETDVNVTVASADVSNESVEPTAKTDVQPAPDSESNPVATEEHITESISDTTSTDSVSENDLIETSTAESSEIVASNNQIPENPEAIHETDQETSKNSDEQAEIASPLSTNTSEADHVAATVEAETPQEEAKATEQVETVSSGLIDSTMTLTMLHSAETIANATQFNQPVVLVVADMADLLKDPNTSFQVFENAGIENNSMNEAALSDQTPAATTTDANQEDQISKLPEEVEKVSAEDEAEKTSSEVSSPDVLAVPELHTATVKVEPDTKNAHVWNELGNVYFNTGAFDEAVSAYSHAIELDDWFAWPYSNLALVHVQKEDYAEAILLYQRSLELFTNDKDKATTWNRLGNVYRRLNDYENAIACYQRADSLDPNNSARSLRSRFSLLGSLNYEQANSLAI